MSGPVLLAALFVCTGGSFFFSGVETGIYVLNRVRLRLRVERGDAAATRVLEFFRRPQLTISTILIGNHVANYGASFFCQEFFRGPVRVGEPEVWTTVVLTPFLFVMGEITPKNVFRLRADPLVYRTSRVLQAAGRVFLPLALFLRWMGRLTGAMPKSVPPPDAMLSRDRLQALVGEVAEEGVLTDQQRRMVTNVMRISSVPVRGAMVPLSEVDAVSEGFDREELLAASGKRGRTRIPVLERASGQPRGVVNVLDLAYRPGIALGDLVQQVPRIPDRSSVNRSLRLLRKARKPMGFVTDRGDRVVGVVTVKDLVEEISGELPAF
jgi:CBS domain containing-hemolysin-like protein